MVETQTHETQTPESQNQKYVDELKKIVKEMIKNKAVYVEEVDEELRDYIEKQGWVVIYEPWIEGNAWIVPKMLEKHMDTLFIAEAHGYLTAEQVSKILSLIYGNLYRGDALLIREFIRDLGIPVRIISDGDDKGLVCVDEYCIKYRRYYCNVIEDEYGNPKYSGVFQCFQYYFSEFDDLDE